MLRKPKSVKFGEHELEVGALTIDDARKAVLRLVLALHQHGLAKLAVANFEGQRRQLGITGKQHHGRKAAQPRLCFAFAQHFLKVLC